VTWLFMAGFAYALGVFWYDSLPGRLVQDRRWRVAAYPFGLMVLAEAYLDTGPKVFGFYPGIDVIAALIAVVIVDWIVMSARRPQIVPSMETHRTANGSPHAGA
jgi:hypothetical protein